VRAVLVALALVGGLLAPAPARAAMDDADYASLSRGFVVKEKLDLELAGGDYFGGLAYAAVHAPADAVMSALLDPENYRRILPLTLEAKVVDRKGELVYVYLKQGGRTANAAYTIVVKRESRHLVRFWLDPDRPHEIADCWGFFRVDPIDERSSLVHYGALVHLDFGVTKLMFAEKIRDYALTTPALLRRFVEGPRSGSLAPVIEGPREPGEKSW
jgi:hypothetical protein